MSKYDFNKVATNFIETTLRHGHSPVNLPHIFRTPFYKNTSGGLLLYVEDGGVVHQQLLNIDSCFLKKVLKFHHEILALISQFH